MMNPLNNIAVLFCCWLAWQGTATADDVAYRKAMAQSVRAAADHVLPSVVRVEVIGTSGEVKGEVEQDAPTSGLIVSDSGEILVSSIVMRRPSATILVVLPDGSRSAATLVAQDHHRDLVLLKIKTDAKLQPVDLSAPTDTPIGATTIAVGRYGSKQSPMVSTGILSAKGRLDGIAIQTDARVTPAMYGGPLIDLYGNVLGVLIPAVAEGGAEDATSWYDSGIAFAIPSDVIAKKLQRLRDGKDIKKGIIGIVAASKDTNDTDTSIAAVRTRSAAELAGVRAGDVVLSVQGTPVTRYQQIRQVLGSYDAEETITLKVKRGDQELDIDVVLTDSIPPLQPQRLGVAISENRSDDDNYRLIIDAIIPGTAADGLLKLGDQITKFDGQDVDSLSSLRRKFISADPDRKVKLEFSRDSNLETREIDLSDVAGPVIESLPANWQVDDKEWETSEIKLPDSANVAAYVAPPVADGEALTKDLGLMVLLLEPGKEKPIDAVKSWQPSAKALGVVVCAIASEDASRWQPKELEVVANFASAMLKKAPIDSNAVAVTSMGAVTGTKASAADSMALAVAFSQSERFFGVAVAAESRPPAVRLRQNEPSTSLQIFMPTSTKDELPTWSAAVEQAGYPIILGGNAKDKDVLRWVRLLQTL
ncbi:PDZ domain-containing protein [Rubripirellula amarantea]|nr:PDZ domain-containing protein [Rubripirellula amarantea]